ncbi:MAG: substrate-binding domain-containing protein [Oscillospiraceae bacterium]|nr:substrate-binding domain-containing protein [Oscillospiraceae bacterium]
MNKILGSVLSGFMAAVMLTGCSSGASQTISVISREDSSGTRSAFVELFEIQKEGTDGKKVDATKDSAEITNSTSVMMTTVQGNKSAIGYISLGSLNDSVKALKIDGADATVENIQNGSYKVSRPFNIVLNDDLSDTAKDFISFIMSDDGQKVVVDNGYVSVASSGAYKSKNISGKISVAGSSSVTPVMEKLKEAYTAINPDAEVQVQQSDSTTGVTSVREGVCDIGMASRELKDSEKADGLTAEVIAMDGIAVIVNKESQYSELKSEDVKKIYMGEITKWSEITQ